MQPDLTEVWLLVSNSSMKQENLRALKLASQVRFAGITNGLTPGVCFTCEGNVWKTKILNVTRICLIFFFRSTKVSTFINEEDNKSVSTNIDTSAAFAWQRIVLRFPYTKKMLDLKTR